MVKSTPNTPSEWKTVETTADCNRTTNPEPLTTNKMNWNPQPTTKSASMEAGITAITGINRREAIASKTCPCGAGVTLDSFKDDELSLKEFHISGLCQTCQDSIFG